MEQLNLTLYNSTLSFKYSKISQFSHRFHDRWGIPNSQILTQKENSTNDGIYRPYRYALKRRKRIFRSKKYARRGNRFYSTRHVTFVILPVKESPPRIFLRASRNLRLGNNSRCMLWNSGTERILFRAEKVGAP